MAIGPGTRIGPYEVTSSLGEGGMGKVWRAHHIALKRDDALKVLPEAFSADPERLARFQREAQVLASLNHPNIAHVYGLEESDGTKALVMELVEGPTLADRIAKGPIPPDDALSIARQIAEALEAAHEQGIIHRDLKPANVKIRSDGTVKVLDFGLAKAIEPMSAASKNLSHSPTITTPAMTHAGVILGTAAYMSPEQARGKAVDKRTDVWAFGCVLFEMLTGRRAFDGDDVSDTLAAVLRSEPHWDVVPDETPYRVRTLLQRCLRKDPQKRLPNIAMARYEIDESSTEPSVQSVASSPRFERTFAWRAMPLAIGIVVASAITAGVSWMLRPQAARPVVARFAIPLAQNERINSPFRNIAISPDGSQIVYAANRRLNLRSLSDPTISGISGSDSSLPVGSPVFSPDGQSIAYGEASERGSVAAHLKVISVKGGVPTTIAQVGPRAILGISWSPEGILYGDPDAGVMRVAQTGGKPEVLMPVAKGEMIQGPSVLPGGRALLFALTTGIEAGSAPTLEMWDSARIFVQTIPGGERKLLLEGGSDPRYLPTGHLLFARGGTMFIAPFDVKRLEVGAEMAAIEGVSRMESGGGASAGFAQFAVSSSGSVVYVSGPTSPISAQLRLVVVDRAGNTEPLNLPPGPYERPRVSPDGARVAYASNDARGAVVWVYDLSGATGPRQLTFDGKSRFPIWSHDGTRVTYQSGGERDAGIYWRRSDGSTNAERLTTPDAGTTHIPESWSRDGKYLLYSVSKGANYRLMVYSIDTKSSTPFGDVQSRILTSPSFSPDGRWIVYTVQARGVGNQVLVQPFPATGVMYNVGEGSRPVWHGNEIFVYRQEGSYVVTVTTNPSFQISNPAKLPSNVFRGLGPGSGRVADILPDGKHFTTLVPSAEVTKGVESPPQLNVILNWFEELKQRVPVK
jgi:serine/threonine-protein kinase